MSYILEALKKAEQKREQEGPSKVPTFLTGAMAESRHRVRWPYFLVAFLVAVLLLNAALAVWRLFPREAPTAPPSLQRPAPIAQAAVAPVPATNVAKLTPPRAPGREKTAVAAAPATPKPAVPKKTTLADVPARPKPSPVPETAAVALVPAAPTLTAPETTPSPQARAEKARPAAAGRVLSLGELPPAIRSALPEFKVSGHAYTPEPQTRVVRINEKILQEGQDLLPGLRVEEIVEGGIVMSYQGYRFRINIKETN
jgi:general secretion pathway protein B